MLDIRIFHTNKSKIVCLPSYREGYPNALIEACSSGCAIITTDVPGCNEIVLPDYNGFLCKPKNIIDLYKKIKKLTSNSKKIKYMGSNSRIIAIKKFKIDTFVNRNYELIIK